MVNRSRAGRHAVLLEHFAWGSVLRASASPGARSFALDPRRAVPGPQPA